MCVCVCAWGIRKKSPLNWSDPINKRLLHDRVFDLNSQNKASYCHWPVFWSRKGLLPSVNLKEDRPPTVSDFEPNLANKDLPPFVFWTKISNLKLKFSHDKNSDVTIFKILKKLLNLNFKSAKFQLNLKTVFFTLKSFVNWSAITKKRPKIRNFGTNIEFSHSSNCDVKIFQILKKLFYLIFKCAKFQQNQRTFFPQKFRISTLKSIFFILKNNDVTIFEILKNLFHLKFIFKK